MKKRFAYVGFGMAVASLVTLGACGSGQQPQKKKKRRTVCVKGDCVNGTGTMLYSTGQRYVGSFKERTRWGKGTFTNADGKVWYSGNKWVRDGRCMKGTCLRGGGKMMFPLGSVFSGTFLNGRLHGKGSIQGRKGNRWVGSYRHGRPHGKVRQYHPRGWVIDGNYRNGRPHGTMEIRDRKGQLIETRSYSNGRLKYKSKKRK